MILLILRNLLVFWLQFAKKQMQNIFLHQILPKSYLNYCYISQKKQYYFSFICQLIRANKKCATIGNKLLPLLNDLAHRYSHLLSPCFVLFVHYFPKIFSLIHLIFFLIHFNMKQLGFTLHFAYCQSTKATLRFKSLIFVALY